MLFAELDSSPDNKGWQIQKKYMGRDQYVWFLEKIKGICESNNVHFFDLNESISKMALDGRWLFIDRVHFTDEGNEVVAKILNDEVIGR